VTENTLYCTFFFKKVQYNIIIGFKIINIDVVKIFRTKFR